MASWLQAQLKVAENLLEAVDRTVQSATSAGEEGQEPSSTASDPAPLPSAGSGYGVSLGAIPFGQTASQPSSGSRLPLPGMQNGTSSPHRPGGPSAQLAATEPLAPSTSASLAAPASYPRSSSSQTGTPTKTLAPASHTSSPKHIPSYTGSPAYSSSPLAKSQGAPIPALSGLGPTSTSSQQSSAATAPPPAPVSWSAPPSSAVQQPSPLSHLSGPPSTSSTHGQQVQLPMQSPASSFPSAAAAETPVLPLPASLGAAGAGSSALPAPMASPLTSVAAAAGASDPPSADLDHLPYASSASSSAPGGSGPASTKEVQLSRLVDTLRKRLDAYKVENQQLEDLLHAAETRASEHLRKSDQLAAELSLVQHDQEAIVASAAASATAQDVQITLLRQELEGTKQQVVALQTSLEALQAQHQQVMASKGSIEGGALEALRMELSSSEYRLEAEHRAHQATKAAATARERALEEQLQEGSGALAGMQHALEEAVARVRDAEAQMAMLGAENGQLKQQVAAASQEASSKVDSAHQLQEAAAREALEAQLAQAREEAGASAAAARAAEGQVAALQQQMQALHADYQAAAASATRGPPQLEQQMAELRELLYQKQAQLERLTADKAAHVMLLERQVGSLREDLARAQQATAAAQVVGGSSGSRHDIIPMDALGEPYQRLARHNKLGGAVQAAANFLDRTAASGTQLLRQQPLVRLIVFLYLILIHLYVYFLLARMQRQALAMIAKAEKETGLPSGLPH